MADSAQSAQIKVGRRVYNALILGDSVVYATKSGESKTLPIEQAQFVA